MLLFWKLLNEWFFLFPRKWCTDSLSHFLEINSSADQSKAGVQLISGYHLSSCSPSVEQVKYNCFLCYFYQPFELYNSIELYIHQICSVPPDSIWAPPFLFMHIHTKEGTEYIQSVVLGSRKNWQKYVPFVLNRSLPELASMLCVSILVY